MIWNRVKAVEADLFTWEYVSAYDDFPLLQEVHAAFVKEFPELCRRSRGTVGGAPYALWPLDTYRASPGGETVTRYLVAVSNEGLAPAGRSARLLPRQIWLYAAARELIRERTSRDGDCRGHYWCYAVVGATLYTLVFFRGRLCHWSEESDYGDLYLTLERFRCFLKTDSLFSRAGEFVEICMGEKFKRRYFRGAARDVFWRGFDLRKGAALGNRAKKAGGARGAVGSRAGAVLLLSLAWLGYSAWSGADGIDCGACIDAVPVPLAPAPFAPSPLVSDSLDGPRGGGPVPAASNRKVCSFPDFEVKGLVAGKLAMVSVAGESAGGAGEVRLLSPGDSLGTFAVDEVGRDRVRFVCGDSLYRRGAGDAAD